MHPPWGYNLSTLSNRVAGTRNTKSFSGSLRTMVTEAKLASILWLSDLGKSVSPMGDTGTGRVLWPANILPPEEWHPTLRVSPLSWTDWDFSRHSYMKLDCRLCMCDMIMDFSGHRFTPIAPLPWTGSPGQMLCCLGSCDSVWNSESHPTEIPSEVLWEEKAKPFLQIISIHYCQNKLLPFWDEKSPA